MATALTALTAAQDERAMRLHREALVVDTLGQISPGAWSPRLEQLVEELLQRGLPLPAISEHVRNTTFSALARGDFPEFWDAWEQCGVTVSSVTMGAVGAASQFENVVHDLAALQLVFDAEPRLVKILSAGDARRAHRDGHVGLILNFQDTSHIGHDLRRVDASYNFGVRIIQLTYNSRNLVGDGCTERTPSGLSHFGLEFVARLNELGILVDASHCSEPTTLDAIKASRAPIAITHSLSHHVYAHDRGKSDDVIRAVAADGGYIGVCAVPFLITSDPRPTLDHWAAHLEHICDLVGPQHAGIGSDWGQAMSPRLAAAVNEDMARVGFRPEHGVDANAVIEGYETFGQWPNFARVLVHRGYSDDEIRGFLGENFLRVFEEAAGT